MLTIEMKKLEAEMDAMVVSKFGYTRGELKEAFKTLTAGMKNWKMPIWTIVRAKELSVMQEACVFFTGSELEVSEDIGDGWLKVMAEGYYNAIGA